MAVWTKSGLYVTTVMDLLNSTAITPAPSAGNGIFVNVLNKIALHSVAGLTDGTAPINYSAASPNWANTSEVSGTGWAAGGVTLSTAAAGGTSTAPAFTESPVGAIKYGMGNVSVATTTLTNVYGCIIYADPITAPAALVKAMLVAVTFGASYSTVAGTFAITWDPLGVWAIDVTP